MAGMREESARNTTFLCFTHGVYKNSFRSQENNRYF